ERKPEGGWRQAAIVDGQARTARVRFQQSAAGEKMTARSFAFPLAAWLVNLTLALRPLRLCAQFVSLKGTKDAKKTVQERFPYREDHLMFRISAMLAVAFLFTALGSSSADGPAAKRDDSASEKLGMKLSLQCWTFNKLTFFETVDKAVGWG